MSAFFRDHLVKELFLQCALKGPMAEEGTTLYTYIWLCNLIYHKFNSYIGKTFKVPYIIPRILIGLNETCIQLATK